MSWPTEQIPLFDTPTYSVVFPALKWSLALTNNPRRVAIIFAAGPTNYRVWPTVLAATVNRGIGVFTNGPPLMLTFKDLGAVICGEWYVVGDGLNTIDYFESIYSQER